MLSFSSSAPIFSLILIVKKELLQLRQRLPKSLKMNFMSSVVDFEPFH